MSDGAESAIPAGPSDVAGWLKGGRPDWSTIAFEVSCSRCGYNLRMLEQPRCPECGLEFHWGDVLQRTANRSPWLFEHQWRKRPIGSWFQTLRRSLRPWRFWSNVSIHDVIERGPLWFLLLTAPLVGYMLLIAVFLGAYAVAVGIERMVEASGTVGPYDLTSYQIWTLMQDLLGQHRRGDVPLALIGLPMGVLLAVLAMICSLRQTLGRCRVRTVQILRVVAYMAAPLCLVALGLLGVGILALLLLTTFDMGAWNAVVRVVLVLGLLGPPMVYLAAGLRHYLRLTHARAVAVVSVLVAVLFIVTVFAAVVAANP